MRIYILSFLLGIMFSMITVKVIWRRSYLARLQGRDPYAIAALVAMFYFVFLEAFLLFCNSIEAGVGFLAGLFFQYVASMLLQE